MAGPPTGRLAWDLVAAVRDRGATVLLVTHFMDKAERLCDRLAVLVRGRIVADGTAAALIDAYQPAKTVRFTPQEGTDVAFLRGVSGVENVQSRAGRVVEVTGTGPVLARVAHALVERGIEPDDLQQQLPSLEDAYLAMTGRAPAAAGDGR